MLRRFSICAGRMPIKHNFRGRPALHLPMVNVMQRRFYALYETDVVRIFGAIRGKDTPGSFKTAEQEKNREGGVVDQNRPLGKLPSEDLYTLCQAPIWNAHKEQMIREIMKKDSTNEINAKLRCREMFEQVRYLRKIQQTPFIMGLGAWLGAAYWAVPNTFGLHTTLNFNENYVTTQVPQPEDLETVFEVGTWSWAWMEPMTGTFTFVICCLQMSKMLLRKSGYNTWGEFCTKMRLNSLKKKYPQYHSHFMEGFVETITVHKRRF